jgi:hypothetical protein
MAIIDLGLFSGCSENHRPRLRCLVSAELPNEALDGLIAPAEPTLGHQVLPDRRRIAALAQTQLNRLTERFAGTGAHNGLEIFRSPTSQVHAKPGGHPIGRFWGFCFCLSLMGRDFGVGVGVGVGVGDHRHGRFCHVRPGGHLVGRFCRWSPAPHTRRPHSDSRCFQVGTGCLPAHPGLLLDAPQRPS